MLGVLSPRPDQQRILVHNDYDILQSISLISLHLHIHCLEFHDICGVTNSNCAFVHVKECRFGRIIT